MESTIKTHKDLIVWQKSIDFVIEIYGVTKSYPQSEQFSLTSQIRRSATSIPANIAEGSGRRGSKEFKRFLYISLGSATELETHLIISEKLKYIDNNTFKTLNNSLTDIIRMLSGLIRSIN